MTGLEAVLDVRGFLKALRKLLCSVGDVVDTVEIETLKKISRVSNGWLKGST